MISANAHQFPNLTDPSRTILPDPPWKSPRTVVEVTDTADYSDLKARLARIPTRSRQRRQSLYIDLWTGQHWLGLDISSPADGELLKPISEDTALAIATIGTYRLLNQRLFTT